MSVTKFLTERSALRREKCRKKKAPFPLWPDASACLGGMSGLYLRRLKRSTGSEEINKKKETCLIEKRRAAGGGGDYGWEAGPQLYIISSWAVATISENGKGN